MEFAAARAEQELGEIDVWVNDAMTMVLAPFVEMAPEDFRRVTEVTYLGYVHGTRAALKRMRPRNRGVIIQVASGLSHRGIPLASAYCGAKYAIRGFTESVRTELLHERSGVHLTLVMPSGTNTPVYGWCKTTLTRHPRPIGIIYQPEVVACAIVWSAEHRRRTLTVGSPSLLTMWTQCFAPGLLDRFLGRFGYGMQQVDLPIDPQQRRNNLWEPLPSEHDAHGAFDDLAHARSPQLWANTHPALLGVFALAVIVALLRRRR